MRSFGLLCLVAASAPCVAASSGLTIAKVATGGTGCPGGTARAVLSADSQTASVLFDDFVADSLVGNMAGAGIALASCDLSVSFNVPQGIAVSIVSLDYRGVLMLDTKATGRFVASYFFAGEPTGATVEQDYYGPKFGELFTVSNELATVTKFSKCGEQVIARVSLTLIAQKNTGAFGSIQLNSADLTSHVVFHLKWKDC